MVQGCPVTLDALRITGTLQQLQALRPPAYLWENTAFQYNWHSKRVSKRDFETVCTAMGKPVCLDAAQFGSRAHRSRNFWTNLVNVAKVEAVTAHIVRPQGLLVDDILDPGRRAQPTLADDVVPQHYHCNRLGQPLEALPTFVAVQRSRAFRQGKQGEIFNHQGDLVEPNPAERERAMGYSGTDTAHLLLSDRDRHEITGKCMDANCMAALMAMCWELTRVAVCSERPLVLEPHVQLTGAAAECLPLLPEGSTELESFVPVDAQVECFVDTSFPDLVLPAVSNELQSEFELLCLVSEVAEVEEAPEIDPNLSSRDVWLDGEMLDYLWHNTLPSDPTTLARVKQRARRYRWITEGEGQLLRVMPDGTTRVVPSPDERVDVVKRVHESLGHFGVKRTRRLVMLHYWWSGMEDDVVRVLKACPHCQQLNTQFTARPTALQPLPIEGYLYRWSCDLAGPLPLTKAGNRYVFIAIEHFSKHIEVAAIPNKEAATTSAVFLAQVLGRFGACAEVVTDQGTEWQAEFHDLLSRSFIDHRMTSPSHPQANGLTERAVQTFKSALAKYCAQDNTAEEWDRHLHYVALGYRCSPQASTRVSPFELMYGVPPVLPMAARPSFEQALEFPAEQPLLLSNVGELESGGGSSIVIEPGADQVAELLLRRAAVLKDQMVAVDGNLRVAQQRDTLRYAAKRDGKWQPRAVRFMEGDFVYRRRPNRVSTLQPKAADGIYRVYEVRDSGVLILQGKCGSLVPEHMQNCAPCHLTGFDPTINPTLAPVPPDLPCEVCGSPDNEHEMLLCDSCNAGYHMGCLQPILKKVPADEWICPRCVGFGVTVQQIKQRDAGNPARKSGLIFRNKSQRLRDSQARALDGRIIRWYPGKNHAWGTGPFYGTLRYEADTDKYPRPLWGEFEQGKQGPWTLGYSSKLLLPEGTHVPLIATAVSVQSLPISATATLTALRRPIPIPPAAAAALKAAVISCSLAVGLDVWTMSARSSHPLRDLVCSLAVNRPNSHGPSADPFSFHQLQGWAKQHPVDVVFVSVPAYMLDEVVMAVLPLVLQVVCIWVPRGTIRGMEPAQYQWLTHLMERGLVKLIPAGDEGCWILVARSTSTWPKCLSTSALAMTAWV